MALATDLEKGLRELLDKQEIHEVMMRYARGVDRLDEESLRSAYHADAWEDHLIFTGPVSEWVPFILKWQAENCTSSVHCIHKGLYDMSGDVAHGEIYFSAYMACKRAGEDYTRVVAGRYVNRFERRNGAWRIARQTMVRDIARDDQATIPLVATCGARSREDPVYHNE